MLGGRALFWHHFEIGFWQIKNLQLIMLHFLHQSKKYNCMIGHTIMKDVYIILFFKRLLIITGHFQIKCEETVLI